MFSRLRRRMVALVVSISGAILLSLLILYCIVNYVQMVRTNEEMLQIYASGHISDSWWDNEITDENTPAPKYFSPGIIKVYAWYDNNLLVVERNNSIDFNVSDQTLYEITNLVMINEGRSGKIGRYNVRYYKSEPNLNNRYTITICSCMMEEIYLKWSISISALTFVGGAIILFVIAIFASKWLIKPTENAWRQQQQFIANASHELKTPLSVIMANNNILMSQKKRGVSENEQWLLSTQAEAEQMKKLIEQMLYLAKSDANMIKSERKIVNLTDIIYSSALSFDSIAYEKNVIIETELEKEIFITADEVELKNVLFVLIDNAVKYSDKGKTVTVSMKRSKNKAEISIKNYGNEIPEKEIPYIFDRFYRVDKSRNKTVEGFGLGLSIANNIVNNMKGSIICESGKETGTIFTVTFPLTEVK